MKTKRFPLVPRSIPIIIALYVLIIVLFLLWAVQIMGAPSWESSGQFSIVIVASFLIPIGLLVYLAIGVFRMFAQRRAGRPGSRLRVRLVGAVFTAVLAAALPMALLAMIFLRSALGFWLAQENGTGLEAGEKLAISYHSLSLQHLQTLAESQYLQSLLDEQEDLVMVWEGLQDVTPQLGALQVFEAGEEKRLGDPRLFAQADFLKDYQGTGPLPRRITGEGTILSWRTDVPGRSVVLSSLLPLEFEHNVSQVSMALDSWAYYEGLTSQVKGSLVRFGLFLSLPLVLLALLIGMTLGDSVVQPLASLGEATGKISEGDYSIRLLAPKDGELGFLINSFNQMIAELEVSHTKIVQTEKVAAWQVIAQRLAHELRNPLTPIKLSAQRVQRMAMKGDVSSQSAERAMTLILREVEGLDQLLGDFRAFAGEGKTVVKAVDLTQLISEALERFQTVAPNLDWVFHPQETLPKALVDARQVRQALVNLLQNALEAGSQQVSIRMDGIRRGSTPYLRVQIRDDGEGISPERSSQVFQPYESSRDRGSGLGLAVAQRIIYDHRGRIWFESEPGVGTVFYIDLPAGEVV